MASHWNIEYSHDRSDGRYYMQVGGLSAPAVNHLGGTRLPWNVRGCLAVLTAAEMYGGVIARETEAALRQRIVSFHQMKFPSDYPFKTRPFPFQQKALDYLWGSPFAMLGLGTGCGKSKVAIDLVAAYYARESVDAMLIICPNSIQAVWSTQLDVHCPYEYVVHDWRARIKKGALRVVPEPEALNVYVVSHELLSAASPKGGMLLEHIKQHHANPALVIDESWHISNPKAKRTKKLLAVAERFRVRMCLNGTLFVGGVEGVYSQYCALERNIFPTKNAYGFQNRYCRMGGYLGREIVGEQNMPDLMARISPFSQIIDKKDVLSELPDTIINWIPLQMPPRMRKVYDSLVSRAELTFNGDPVECDNALVAYNFLSQVTAGVFKNKYRFPEYDKSEALDEIHRQHPDSHIIVWCKFVEEVKRVAAYLRAKNYEVSELHTDGDVDLVVQGFKKQPPGFLVASYSKVSLGVSINEADVTVYMSPSHLFHWEQSQGRNKRIGQDAAKLHEYRIFYQDTMEQEIYKMAEKGLNVMNHLEDLLKVEAQRRGG